MRHILLYAVITILPALSLAAPQSPIRDADLIAAGKRIYHDGILLNGKPLQAKSASDTIISGNQLSCVSCHRRSGLGSSEGGQRIPPIAGNILFEARTQVRRGLRNKRLSGAGARPAYTTTSLKQAITAGTAVNGNQLDPLMPRFVLSDADLEAVIAYMQSIDVTPAAGITDSHINIATVIGPGVPAAQKTAMLTTMQAYFSDFNAQSRGEQKRADHSPWHKSWHYDSFRSFKLHQWQLRGSPDTWRKQLNDFYRKQPVYALLNGITKTSWAPIHQFCEYNQIPCLFPTTDLPTYDSPGYYSIYFSAGLKLEVETLVSHIKQQSKDTTQRIVQVYQAGNQGQSAAQELTQTRKLPVTSYKLPKQSSLATAFWKTLFEKDKPDTLILWLDTSGLVSLAEHLDSVSSRPRIYLSDTFINIETNTIPNVLQDNTYLLSRFIHGKRRHTHLSRMRYWAKPRKVDTKEEQVVANAYFAATMFGSAIKKMRAYLTRDYLLERFEHMLENSVFHSIYPGLSLGPEQRFASKGCYIIGPLSQQEAADGQPPAKWIIPHIN